MCEFISLFLNIIITITILVDYVATNNWGLLFDKTVAKTKKVVKGFLALNWDVLVQKYIFWCVKVTPVSQRWADLVSVGFYSSNHYHCRSVTKTSVTLTNWPISPPRPSEAQPAIWVSCDGAISWYSVTKYSFKCFLLVWICLSI